ncbi:MAG TPA: aminoglycoside phosphotransferase family protein [Elusimicrobiota bacterium]|jgi:Ser/Thr protein kinase RdoA (MazF antagonist)|nr:aminoglycoside phosphotransferase family protein [Elusimicrobiota bacterium]
MTRAGAEQALSAARRFRLSGEPLEAAPLGRGIINDTFAVRLADGRRAVLQRVNTAVFRDPRAVMANIARVCAHVGRSGARVRVPIPVPSRAGEPFWDGGAEGFWRAAALEEGALSLETVDGPALGRETGRGFGAFAAALLDLGPPRLAETIPGFHDTRARLDDLEEAVRGEALGRSSEAGAELAFIRGARPSALRLAEAFAEGRIPERTVHNDTKAGNLLFDARTREAACVVDLDTVMPGLLAHDFGDMVRAAASGASEDEPDLSRVALRSEVCAALAEGFVGALAGALEERERDSLALGPAAIALELGSRFLADYLRGDAYFKTRRPRQNLDRCRVQLRLAELLFREEEPLASRIREYSRR